MKKTLLLSALAAFACVANAQTVVGLATVEQLEAAGLSSTKKDIAGGTVIVNNEAGSFGLAYDDDWGYAQLYKNYQTVSVNDSGDITLENGAVGNQNPVFTGYSDGVMSEGAVFELEAKKDGWMTIFTKINPNKQYVVFQNTDEGVAYTLGVAGADYKIYYTLPGVDGLVDLDAADADRYFLYKSGDMRPTNPYVAAGLDSAPAESTGFLAFPVKADNTYYISALGSKACMGGFVYTEAAPTVTFKADGDLPEVVFGDGSAVESIAVSIDENAPIYNAQGVRVNADAKGLLIQNGKKFIRK